jgi:hypothetical protein
VKPETALKHLVTVIYSTSRGFVTRIELIRCGMARPTMKSRWIK